MQMNYLFVWYSIGIANLHYGHCDTAYGCSDLDIVYCGFHDCMLSICLGLGQLDARFLSSQNLGF